MTMMLALTVREVQSLGNALTFRQSENRAKTSPHRGEWRERKEGKEKERDRGRGRRRSTRGHKRDCSYDAHEKGRQ